MAIDLTDPSKYLGVKNPYLLHLLQQSNAPVKSHWQGASNMANALLAGLEQGKLDRLDAEDRGHRQSAAGEILGLSGGPQAVMPQPQMSPRMTPEPVGPEGPHAPMAPPSGNVSLPPVRQATEDMVSAVPETGPNAGVNIAPGIQADAGRVSPQIKAMVASQNPYVRQFGLEALKKAMSEKPDKPEYGVVGQGPSENPIYGWIDKANRRTTPVTGGGMSTKDTGELRKEVQGLPSYKNISAAAPVYKSMAESVGRDNRAADVNMIYGLAKIMDPGSVVRESEMTIAQAVSTLPQKLQSTIMSQLEGKGRLSPEVRNAILTEAHSRVQAYKDVFDTDIGMYRGIVQRGGMNEADVIPTFGPFSGPKAVPEDPEKLIEELRRRIEERRRQGR